MDITEPFARSMVLASDPLSAEKRFQAETLSADLCVGETSVPLNDISFSSQVKAGLFDLDHKKVLFAQNMYDQDRKSTRLNSSHPSSSRMPSSA